MEIGDYVRTINGKIYRILDNDLGDYIRVENEYNGTYKIDISNTTKSSSNILDLIKENDYVNGYKVSSVAPYGVYIDIPFIDSESIGCNVDLIETEDIKSIVTKEQFESIKYRIGE